MELKIPAELPKLIEALTSFAWPVFAAIFLWKIYPSLRQVIDSRQFAIKIGGMEVSVQQASENLAAQVADLQEKVSELRAALDERAKNVPAQPVREDTAKSPDAVSAQHPTKARRILWVDDHPQNNVFEIAKLRAEGIDVKEVPSTTEAMRLLISGREPFGLVISDMGRRENGQYRAKAGLILIENIRSAGLHDLPIVVYASPRYLERTRDEVREAGGNAATASPVEIFEIVHSYIPPAE
jgi:CheY-like chemotaxis protein